MTNYEFTTVGFSSGETEQIKNKITIVCKNRSEKWSYVKFIKGQSYDLAFMKKRKSTEVNAGLVVLNHGSKKADNEMIVTLPMRVFDLLHILETAEDKVKKLSKPISNGSVIRDYARNQTAGYHVIDLELKGKMLLGLKNKKVWLQKNALDSIRELLTVQVLDEDIKQIDDVKLSEFKSYISLNGFLWSLALRENVDRIHDWNIFHDTFKLSAYPTIGEYENSAYMLRLAALFSRKQSTIKMAMDMCNIGEKEVKSFLHACSMVDVNMEIEKNEIMTHAPIKIEKQIEPITQPNRGYGSLLRGLRKKISAAFGSVQVKDGI